MFDIDSDKAAWAETTETKRCVRVVCDGRKVEVYVGDMEKPLQSTTCFDEALMMSPDVGYARFRGTDMRVSNIVVRKCETD